MCVLNRSSIRNFKLDHYHNLYTIALLCISYVALLCGCAVAPVSEPVPLLLTFSGGVIEEWAETKPFRFTVSQWSEAGVE